MLMFDDFHPQEPPTFWMIQMVDEKPTKKEGKPLSKWCRVLLSIATAMQAMHVPKKTFFAKTDEIVGRNYLSTGL